MSGYPNISQAITLWQERLSGVLSYSKNNIEIEYIYHTTNVADAAYRIAQKCNLDTQKAYIAGLLHDYGKIQNEKKSGLAHFIVGYEKMIELGFDFVAKICLSHSFPIKDFSFDDYSSYKIEDLIKVKNILSKVEYDEYDRLIQLCDIFFEGTNKVTYQKRIECIKNRYNLTDKQLKSLTIGAENNKLFFDKLCGCDVYSILNIKS